MRKIRICGYSGYKNKLYMYMSGEVVVVKENDKREGLTYRGAFYKKIPAYPQIAELSLKQIRIKENLAGIIPAGILAGKGHS